MMNFMRNCSSVDLAVIFICKIQVKEDNLQHSGPCWEASEKPKCQEDSGRWRIYLWHCERVRAIGKQPWLFFSLFSSEGRLALALSSQWTVTLDESIYTEGLIQSTQLHQQSHAGKQTGTFLCSLFWWRMLSLYNFTCKQWQCELTAEKGVLLLLCNSQEMRNGDNMRLPKGRSIFSSLCSDKLFT